MSTVYIQSTKPLQSKYPILWARRIGTIAENNADKLRNLENLRSNLPKYPYLYSQLKQGFQKPPSIPQKDLQNLKNGQMKTSCYSLQHLIQITRRTIALLNPRLNAWKINVVNVFHNISLMQSKRQPPNVRKVLTNAVYGVVLSRTFICSDKRWMLQASLD